MRTVSTGAVHFGLQVCVQVKRESVIKGISLASSHTLAIAHAR